MFASEMSQLVMNIYASVEDAFLTELRNITALGNDASPRHMTTREQLGCGFRIADPRARLIFNPRRKWSIFYALGELLWHLAGSNELAFISYYSKKWLSSSDDGITVKGSCYGHTMFSAYPNRPSQWEDLLGVLRSDPDTRRAVVSLYDADDLTRARWTRDVPCTCTLHFFMRDNAISLISYTRSNDIILGFCYDIFIFTMFQELLALRLGCEVGWYQHMVGSLHLYEKHWRLATDILETSRPERKESMSVMLHPDQITQVIEYERQIRVSSTVDPNTTFHVAPYWANILVVLLYYKLIKIGNSAALPRVKERLQGTCYYDLLSPALDVRR